ncbi:MAG: CPBP family intramembrane metalloprotease [Eubacterium sp.]|nr:CPBP family intramembrane metalloprotease [Eubacterium sp.]
MRGFFIKNKIIHTLLKKEILDVLRDKKAVIMMLGVPLLLYPLIFFGVVGVMSSVQKKMDQRHYKAIIDANDNGALLKILKKYATDGDQSTGIIDAVSRADYPDPIKALSEEEIDVYVITEKNDTKDTYRIFYLSSKTNSDFAKSIVEMAAKELKLDITRERLEEVGLNSDIILEPIEIKSTDTSSKEQSIGKFLGMFLPILLVISLLLGTVYPAIDVTAGEKERGTLETLLTLPVTNAEIIISKFLTVATIGLISAGLNIVSIISIGIYIYRVMVSLNARLRLNMGHFNPAVLLTIMVIIVFSLFISAIVMCVTSFAKSFKEANNYITPLTIVVMLTGYVGFIPNMELTPKAALIPVANVILVIKNLFMFKYDFKIIAIVILSTFIYTVIAVFFLCRMYSSERLLFDEGRYGVQIFEKRKNMVKGGVPTSGDAWFVMAVVLVHVLYVGSLAQLKYGRFGVYIIQAIILVVPLVFAFYTKKDFKRSFSIKKTGLLSYLAGIVLMIGTILVGMIITEFMTLLFPDEASNVANALYVSLVGDNFWETLILTAVLPCVAEEMLFRGFLLSGFRSRFRAVYAILIVSVSFGLYHMSVVRFFTTALMGAALCSAVYYTQSIFPAMLMHFINNAIATANMYHPDVIERIFPIAYGDIQIIGLLIVVFIGILLIYAGLAILNRIHAKLIKQDVK